jgi:hypothetical protein
MFVQTTTRDVGKAAPLNGTTCSRAQNECQKHCVQHPRQQQRPQRATPSCTHSHTRSLSNTATESWHTLSHTTHNTPHACHNTTTYTLCNRSFHLAPSQPSPGAVDPLASDARWHTKQLVGVASRPPSVDHVRAHPESEKFKCFVVSP